jgi:asparagine synthase (glutamine-hydrolysing)
VEELPAGGQRSSRPEASGPAGGTPALLGAEAGATKDVTTRDAGAAVVAGFEDSVRLHLESDVPVGAFLSGGLDSAAIVGTMKRLGVTPKTFTVCFGDFDESVAARATASFVGSEHHEVTLSSAEVLAMVPEAVARMDSPSADGINSYVVSRAVRGQGLKVALSGLGGDELFGGYPSFARARTLSSRLLRATPRPLRAALGGALSAGAGWSTTLAKAADALAMPGTLTDLYLESRALFSRAQVARLTGAPAGEHPMRERLLALERSIPERPLTFISIAEMTTYMRDTLLRDTDQMSMANGLEVRVPFLDVAFARMVLALPDDVKFGRGHERETADGESLPLSVTKPLLVQALADRIPAQLHSLPKRGFSLPMRQWMRGPLRDYCLDRLRSTALRDVGIDGGAAMAVWKAFEDGSAKWSRPWALVVLADWAERNL